MAPMAPARREPLISWSGRGAVLDFLSAGAVGAVRAAEDRVVLFDPMPDDRAATMRAAGRQRLNGAFKRIKDVRLPVHHDLEGLIVGIAACLTFAHIIWFIPSGSSLLDLKPRVLPRLKAAVHFHHMKTLASKTLCRFGSQMTGLSITIEHVGHIGA